MSFETPGHLLEADQRRRREEERERWEREHRHRESEVQRARELARHRPSKTGEHAAAPAHAAASVLPVVSPREIPPLNAVVAPSTPSPTPADRRPPPPRTDAPFRIELPPPPVELSTAMELELPPPSPPASSPPPPPSPSAPAASFPPTPLAPHRPGAPLHGTALHRLLAMDASERFDLEGLNALSWPEVARELEEDGHRRREVVARISELLARVRQETDEPVAAGSLLRSRVVDWYLRSPMDAEWPERMPLRWGGIFADSREAGGRLHPWLVQRLQQGAPSGHAAHPLARLLGRRAPAPRSVQVPERSPAQLWMAEVAQALLDDLASHRRPSHGRVALVRLSELAVRRTPETVNDALASLFSSSVQGSFVVLHPNRYPECDLVAIRAPPRGAMGAALSYVLQVAPARVPVAEMASPAAAGDSHATSMVAEGLMEDPTEDPWSREERSAPEWKGDLASFKKQHRHLPAPPKEFRQLAPYRCLRALVAEDPAARSVFLHVKWRGKPQGLLLLAKLLAEGSLSPEVSTDYEYLDSELSDLEKGDPEHHPDPAVWKLAGGTVRREGSFQAGYRYVFEMTAPAP